MFRTIARKILPNPFERMLKRCVKKQGKKILLCWNRGLGDIALGLFAMVERIRAVIPDAEITFLTRENLLDGFSMLEGVKTVGDPSWKRGEVGSIQIALDQFDLIIEKPDPTEWVKWQLGKVTPRLKWDAAHESAWEKFSLPPGYTYVGVQISAETNYGFWRNWPLTRWQELFERLRVMGNFKVLLFGSGKEILISGDHVIDLRGKTALFELLSIIKNRCDFLILPDSGILSMVYYLNVDFPIRILSLWADPKHGILKQSVPSPNRQLKHIPLIGSNRDLSQVTVDDVLAYLVPPVPLQSCPSYTEIKAEPIEPVAKLHGSEKSMILGQVERPGEEGRTQDGTKGRFCAPKSFTIGSITKTGVILLAGGQGTRLGCKGPKGCFPIHGRSLFEWICEKTPVKDFPIAIMTSKLNHEETVAFFKKRAHFGREIYFFSQPTDLHGPDGNGSVFRAFVEAGLDRVFESKQIDVVTVIPVDNALADPADAALVTYHRMNGHEVTIKCVERLQKNETMGALVEREKRIEIVEYLDLNPKETYKYNNSGMMAMNLSFICKMARMNLPLHYVHKQIGGRWVWKGERFIFDALAFAEKVGALCYPRQSCYAPLKSLDQLQEIERMLS